MNETATTTEWTEPLVRRLIEKNKGRDPRAIIKSYADRLRSHCEQGELPIDVESIRSYVGIRRRFGSFEFAGRIYAERNGQLVMDLNADDSYERQRFTCAHELIHPAFPGFKRESRYRLDPNVGTHRRSRSEEEYLCDIGGAELLMPRELVVDRYSASCGLADVERLHRDAEVSLEAAGNRLVQLADEPVALLVFQMMNKPADERALRRGENVEPRLRLRYCTANALDIFVPKYKSADDDSVIVEALNRRKPVRGIELLPGQRGSRFEIEAGDYSLADRRRVLAIARPA